MVVTRIGQDGVGVVLNRRHFGKVYQRIWRNQDFVALSDAERTLALYLLTGPQCNRVGIFRFSIALAAEDLERDLSDVRQWLDRVTAAFGWRYDAAARVLWIPSWWAFNHCENPKNMKGYLGDLQTLPRTPLEAEFLGNLGDVPPELHPLFQAARGRGPLAQQSTPIGDDITDRIADPSCEEPGPLCEPDADRTLETEIETEKYTHIAGVGRGAAGFSTRPATCLEGTLPRDHIAHAWCGDRAGPALKCVPSFLHREFLQALGTPWPDEAASVSERKKCAPKGLELFAFYERTNEQLRVGPPNGLDPVKFWRQAFAEAYQRKAAPKSPANRWAPAAETGVRQARRAWACPHEPRCASFDACAVVQSRVCGHSPPCTNRAACLERVMGASP